MAGFTTAYGNSVMDHIFRNQALTPPAAVYVGYSTDGAAECADANYVRKAITFGAFAGKASANTGVILFETADAGHNVHSFALFTAETSGTQMTDWKARTGGTLALEAGQQARIPVGDYDLASA
jgi:hypothetical protein